ncbi:hypothetical protein SK128_006910, partial [Halocaridina rubra]
MQDLEVVIVNFEPGKPIYTEAVFTDPEVRSIQATREAEARNRRREARRRRRQARTRQVNNSNNTAGDNHQHVDLDNADEADNSDNENDSGSDAQGNQIRRIRINGEDGTSDEWFVIPFPHDERIQHSDNTASNRNRRVPQTLSSERVSHANRTFLSVPPANPNRYHPNEEEELWLSPEPTPINSPIHSPVSSPVVQRLGKKWKENVFNRLSGCHTCRGDLAILSRHRPKLQKDAFVK